MSLSQLVKAPVMFIHKQRVIALQASEYPFLFMRKLLEKITYDSAIKPTMLDVATQESGQIILRLSTSFLGQPCFYWLGDTSVLSLKNSVQLVDFLMNYQGEHTILLYTQQMISGPAASTVELPEKINATCMHELVALYPAAHQPRCYALVRDVFKRIGWVTLERAVMLLDYASVLGSNRKLFVDNWLEILIKPESSLFELSEFLLARDQEFWRMWSRVKHAYEFPFWISYFSELFFRAYYYGFYRKQNQLVQAKKIGYRLPFSFIQRDWQKLDRELLRLAHDYVTTLDYQLKNGATLEILDSIFVLFFS